MPGVEKAGSDYAAAGLFLHGSTVAINTILERTGARTALLITEGFRDIYEIGRINRPDAYNLFFQKHVPLVERALRFEVQRARAGRRRGRAAARRGRDRGARRRARRRAASRPARSCSSTAMRNADHEARAKAILETQPSRHVRLGLARAVSRNIASSSAARRWSPTPISGRRCAAMSARSTSTSAATGFGGSFLIVQSTGGLYEAGAGAEPMRAHAGIRAGRRRDRHAGAVPHARHRQRHRLRHGRHHRQGRRHLQGRGADHRRRR